MDTEVDQYTEAPISWQMSKSLWEVIREDQVKELRRAILRVSLGAVILLGLAQWKISRTTPVMTVHWGKLWAIVAGFVLIAWILSSVLRHLKAPRFRVSGTGIESRYGHHRWSEIQAFSIAHIESQPGALELRIETRFERLTLALPEGELGSRIIAAVSAHVPVIDESGGPNAFIFEPSPRFRRAGVAFAIFVGAVLGVLAQPYLGPPAHDWVFLVMLGLPFLGPGTMTTFAAYAPQLLSRNSSRLWIWAAGLNMRASVAFLVALLLG